MVESMGYDSRLSLGSLLVSGELRLLLANMQIHLSHPVQCMGNDDELCAQVAQTPDVYIGSTSEAPAVLLSSGETESHEVGMLSSSLLQSPLSNLVEHAC